MPSTLNILELNSSPRGSDSVSRQLSADVVSALADTRNGVTHVSRDLGQTMSFVDADWVDATFAAADDRDDAARQRLAESDALIAELRAADVLVIGVAMHNFTVPAPLKAWIDLIVRPGETFQYTADGPVGLLDGKKAYIALATGGVPVNSAADFATPYLKQILGFVGISDVDVFAADELIRRGNEAVADATRHIQERFYPTTGDAQPHA